MPTVARMWRPLLGLALISLLVQSCGRSRQAFNPDGDLCGSRQLEASDIFKRSKGSVVKIETATGLGSGFVVKNDNGSIILTNAHVVKGNGGQLTVKDVRGNTVEAQLLAVGEGEADSSDLALIKTDVEIGTPLKLDDEIETASTVYAIGSPLGQEWSISQGIISRFVTDQGLIQTDIAINPGNSGGPVLDKRGCVVGVVVSKLDPAQSEGIGFAIEPRIAERYVKENAQNQAIALDQFSEPEESQIEQVENPERSDAGYEVCNQSGEKLSVAIAYFDTSADSYRSEGWWNLDKEDCQFFPNLLNRVDEVYVFAESDQTLWSGDFPFCMQEEAFDYTNANRDRCPDPAYSKGFLKIEVGDAKTWTTNLTPPQ
ncbi:trypsin-like peptidase domain-containing protein [Synechococcus elongatus]|uniref:trypsin-like peptidase domain-containing protein n=1 Tax=Synechococcus elongatus TaxID=32046 RepID=UPI0030CC66EC